ncbi:MAG: hypothetical protein ACOX2E_01970 [Syntrophaceticus sp.]|jgi:hypothetical protein
MKDERGFLLAELTVTLALLVVVLAVSSVFFFFCQRSFYEGEKKTIVQSNVRLAANYITKEVRYADNISTDQSKMPSGTTYYCLKQVDGILQEVISKPDGLTETRTITQEEDVRLDSLTFDFGPGTDSNDYFLTFTITGSDEASEHARTITSQVLLVNIKDLPEGFEWSGETAIYFTKPSI